MKSQKNAVRQIGIYKRNIASGTELYSERMEEFEKTLSKYLNKDGSLSKSKLRTEKAKREYNRAITEFNKTSLRTQKSRLEVQEARVKGLEDSDIVKDNSAGDIDGQELLETFAELSYDKLSKEVGFTSGDIIKLTSTVDKVDKNVLRSVAEYMLKDMNEKMPTSIKQWLETDDAYNTAKRMLEYIEDNDISVEDIDETFDRLKNKEPS